MVSHKPNVKPGVKPVHSEKNQLVKAQNEKLGGPRRKLHELIVRNKKVAEQMLDGQLVAERLEGVKVDKRQQQSASVNVMNDVREIEKLLQDQELLMEP